MGFNRFDAGKYPNMHSCFGIYDIKTGCQLTDKLEIHCLELPKFKASEAAIQEAMEVEDVFTKDEVAKWSYEKAEKFRRDQAARLKYARTEMIKNPLPY